MLRLVPLLIVVGAVSFSLGAEPDFARDIQPILAKACYSCHGPEKQKGGLRLDSKASAFGAADEPGAILPKQSDKSPLYQRIISKDSGERMPPKGEALPAEQARLIKAWIDAGASWPETKVATEEVWWSLKALKKPAVPNFTDQEKARFQNPIDAFIYAELKKKGFGFSPEADRRTLIRRLSFDLLGLPPTPEAVEAFVNDRDPKAYEKLVGRLLNSPQYGERWARHWLDVVHYGDSHGYDKDKPRPNAWPYRDYVIRSFNSDKPYGRFIQEQLAGDTLFPGQRDGIEALGFISAGPWDFIGHAELPEDKIDGKIARHLDRDDMVATTMSSFQSLTVHCAQCHNHKFDPISQEDYYRLQAVFAALDRTDKSYDLDPKVAARRLALQNQRQTLEEQRQKLQDELVTLGGPQLADLNRRLIQAKKPRAEQRPEFGYHSNIEAKQETVKWVQIDLGQPKAFESIALFACDDDFNNIGAGFGFPVRFKVETSDDPLFKEKVHLIVDRTESDFPNPGTKPQTFSTPGSIARYLRITATKLAPRQNDFIFALAELEARDAAGKNIAKGAAVTSLDSIEALPRWSRRNLTDGLFPGQANTENAEKLQAERLALIQRVTSKEWKEQLRACESVLFDIRNQLAKLPPQQAVYAGTIHTGGGTFVGTGAQGGKPRPIYFLKRGDVKSPGREVAAGPLASIPQMANSFPLPADHAEGARRAALAQWITHSDNPLTWRSIVNRVWLYHLGRGLVDTPNDFGRMGQSPTHPELLDWLAADFRDGKQSFKELHRLIVSSTTYRQASIESPELQRVDANNTLYGRMTRRKLEAEAVRDSMLAVAGKLDLKMGGPAFQDFVVDKPEHSPHYEYHLYDPEDPKTHRRSVYRFIVRSQLQPFMASLDCADPALLVDKRNQTISPLQALALLNNPLSVTLAKHFAKRIETMAPDTPGRLQAAFRLAFTRQPTEAELRELTAYANQHGLANACRVILNMNEFVFVD
jgi:hypothetical protein